MTLHLLKLCVGVETVAELAEWQAGRIRELRKKGKKTELAHITRQMPKKADELLDGGSLYWVIKGQIAVRQKLLALRPVVRGGTPHCALVYHHKLVPVTRRMQRPFQGWRYLKPEAAPSDARGSGKGAGLPEALKAELVSLGLL